MRHVPIQVFETRITSEPAPNGCAVFVAAITVGGIVVHEQYYSNNPDAQTVVSVRGAARVTTRKDVATPEEAEAWLLRDFAFHLKNMWGS